MGNMTVRNGFKRGAGLFWISTSGSCQENQANKPCNAFRLVGDNFCAGLVCSKNKGPVLGASIRPLTQTGFGRPVFPTGPKHLGFQFPVIAPKLKAVAPCGKETHTHTHFELGFSVNAIVSMGRKAMERQGGKVS